MSWTTDELKTLNLGDARLNQRLVKTVEQLAVHPAESVPEACGSVASAKAVYRLWDKPRVADKEIRAAHVQATRARCLEELDALTATQAALPTVPCVVTVSDREGDIFNFLAAPRRQNHHLLIRAAHNRRVKEEVRWLDVLLAQAAVVDCPLGWLSRP